MEQWPEPNSPVWSFLLPPQDWEQTRSAVQASLRKVLDRDHEHAHAAGRCARRLLREREALWVLLSPHGVEPTNHRAERARRNSPIALGSMSAKTLPDSPL